MERVIPQQEAISVKLTASIPEIFDHYARHTETGAAMPADLKERMLKSISFQTAYSLGENLAATFVI